MKRALPTPEVLAKLVSVLPDFDIEVVTVKLPTGRFEHLADTEHAMRIASDLIEEAIQTAHGQGSVPPIEVWDEDCAERVSISVSLTGPDKDNYESEEDYKEARTSYLEDKTTGRKAVSALVQAVVRAVLASDPRSRLEDALYGRGDARRLAEILYASLDVGNYIEPDVWTPPGMDEVQVSFDLEHGIHVIVVISAAPGGGAALCLTANNYEDEENDPELFKMLSGIRTPQAWTEAVRLIQEQVHALSEGVPA